MIKETELRVGNWVDLHDSVTGSKFVKATTGIINASDFIKPIPLTPEILEKCGFVPTYRNSFYHIRNSDFPWIKINEDGTFELSVCDPEYSIATFKHLHQLQNLYFALTGEELKVNLTEPQLS